MGFITEIYLYCDGNCQNCLFPGTEASEGDGRFETRGRYRKAAKQDGWIFKPGNKAYCPKCAKNLKNSNAKKRN